MRLNGKFLLLAMLALMAFAGAGCSGINAGTSVSPASFFLPGLMKADPPTPQAPVAVLVPAAPAVQLALAP